jgi:phosphopantothenate synthetase
LMDNKGVTSADVVLANESGSWKNALVSTGLTRLFIENNNPYSQLLATIRYNYFIGRS